MEKKFVNNGEKEAYVTLYKELLPHYGEKEAESLTVALLECVPRPNKKPFGVQILMIGHAMIVAGKTASHPDLTEDKEAFVKVPTFVEEGLSGDIQSFLHFKNDSNVGANDRINVKDGSDSNTFIHRSIKMIDYYKVLVTNYAPKATFAEPNNNTKIEAISSLMRTHNLLLDDRIRVIDWKGAMRHQSIRCTKYLDSLIDDEEQNNISLSKTRQHANQRTAD